MSDLPRYRAVIVPQAISEIEDICSYIERESPQNAGMVAEKLIAAIDSLKVLPRRFRVHQHRLDKTKSVHAMPVWPFIIYYRVDDATRVVRILTVRHGARRQPKRFG